MRMIVIGTGPIGGIIGGRLARAGHDLTFVDIDRAHVEAIRANGLQVDVPDGPFNVNINILYPQEITGRFDVGFIAVRSNYTPDALDTLMPHLAEDGLLVSMQNGLNPPLLEQRVGTARTIGMAIRMGCRKIAPGHLQTTVPGHLYIGHLHGDTTAALNNLHVLFNSVMDTEISDNILGVLWSKLTYTCLGYFGSLADAALAVTCATKTDRRMLVDVLSEVVAVGQAGGARFIPLAEYNPADFHPSKPLESRLAVVDEMARSWNLDDRKGPLRQIKNGIKTEADFTLGYVVQEGKRLHLPTPICERLLQMIRELQAGTRELGQLNYAELTAVSRA